MTKSILLIFGLLFSLNFYAQDVIVRTDGTMVNCDIISEDSTTVYLNTKIHNKTIESFIQKEDIQKIIYGKETDNSTPETPFANNAVTIGILEGGGALVGLDCEFLVYKNIGVQFGLGLLAYGAGINFHFKPHAQSSFISLMYWHQGIGESHTISSFGPAYIFRAKKLFTAQLGLSKTLTKGPNYPQDIDFPPVMLTYAIGIYLPW